MARKRYYLVLLLCLIFGIQSCGNDAPFDVVVKGPEDLDPVEFAAAGVGALVTPAEFTSTGPLVFTVQTSGDTPAPVSNANVRIDVGSGANVVALLLNPTGTACFRGSAKPTGSTAALLAALSTLTPADCFGADTQTDANGSVRFKVAGEIVAGCGSATADIDSFANAQVTASASFDSTSIPVTFKCAP